MKKDYGLKMICGIMVFSLLSMPAAAAWANGKETRENEKLYRNADNYAFEKDLSLAKPMEIFEENSKKVASVINNPDKRKAVIDKDMYELINEFVNGYLDGYMTETMPDMSGYYELSNNIRVQNKLLIEAFVYKDAINKSNNVEDIDYAIDIAEAVPVTETVHEVLFYVERTFHTNEGDERGGTWFLMQMDHTENGCKILNVWIQNYEFEMMQENFKDKYLSENALLNKEVIRKDILKEHEEK